MCCTLRRRPSQLDFLKGGSSRSPRVTHSFHYAGAPYKCLYGGAPYKSPKITENRRKSPKIRASGRPPRVTHIITDRKIKLRRPHYIAVACRSLTTQHGKVHFRFLPCRVSVARSFNTHAAPRLHGRNHVLLLPCSNCAMLDFNSFAAQSLRGSRPHRPAPCRPYAADGY